MSRQVLLRTWSNRAFGQMGKVAAFMVAKGAKVVAVNAASAYQARLMEATVYYI